MGASQSCGGADGRQRSDPIDSPLETKRYVVVEIEYDMYAATIWSYNICVTWISTFIVQRARYRKSVRVLAPHTKFQLIHM